MKKRKPEIVFIICNKNSGRLHFTMRSTKRSAIEEVTHNYCDSWASLKSDGYFVEKILISPIKKKIKK